MCDQMLVGDTPGLGAGIAHNLPADEVRRRMTARVEDLFRVIPCALGRVEHPWKHEDPIPFTIGMRGKSGPLCATIGPDPLATIFELPPRMVFC